MGAWGTALFSDDTACDVRDDYRDLIGDGHTGPEATAILLDQWNESLLDPDDGPVFWLALAVTQWKCGRIEEHAKRQALQVIDDGTDLIKWESDPKDMKKRQEVLLKVREQLNSPQPPEKRIPKRFRDSCDWGIGELISYKLNSNKVVLFRIIGYQTDKGGTSPVCELLNWIDNAIPEQRELSHLGVKTGIWAVNPPTQFLLGRVSNKEFPQDRVNRLGITLKPSQKVGGYMVFLWRYLDRQLKELFGVE